MANILVVDDSPVSQRLLNYMLRRIGDNVVLAANGREALDAIADGSIDLVIADLAMPEVDGLTLLQQVRQSQPMEQLPLVMLTASGQDQDRVAARAAGANDFLTKPASSREIIETVNRVLRSS